ncbi:RING-H2 finger protein ATL70-like [Phoenix dactylifera]|uniref:RING-type E3 ubiquitin transferase n=1 Tax=Phoenix dactylifera TaxID=42345 RepID=A0A8B7CLG7_PHODC|nr:RING-H2 finger protein ATL70-like [Phoenix dactylifera]
MSNFFQPLPNPMSSTDTSGDGLDRSSGGGHFSSDHTGEFRYGAGVSVGILLLITTITLSSYYCNRANTLRPAPPDNGATSAVADVEAGIDEATLMNFPKVLYSETKLRDEGTTSSCCSICLADYKDSDVLRDLPDCRHLFHAKCVDPWLRLHPTCPVCRTSPLPTPLPTPLAEVVPLATHS